MMWYLFASIGICIVAKLVGSKSIISYLFKMYVMILSFTPVQMIDTHDMYILTFYFSGVRYTIPLIKDGGLKTSAIIKSHDKYYSILTPHGISIPKHIPTYVIIDGEYLQITNDDDSQ
jgi:hypothetical protein